MNVYQPSSDTSKLKKSSDRQCNQRKDGTSDEEPTSLNRSASECILTNSLMFPFAIHSDTNSNRVSVIVTPISGNTFGCRRYFHVTASLQNFCVGSRQWNDGKQDSITSNLHRLSSASPYMKVFLSPSLQRHGRDIPPSIRHHTHHCRPRCPFCHSKEGFGVISEGSRCDRTSCIKLSDLSFGSVAESRGCPVPSQKNIS